MNSKVSRKKIPVKSIFHHVIRAKLYGVLTMNALEGMMKELSNVMEQEVNEQSIDIFDERFRRYQNGVLLPTSHGDFLDRAVKSLAKDLDLPVSIDLVNAQSVKRIIMTLSKGTNEQERQEILKWLNEDNEVLTKSEHFDKLVNNVCMFYYKQPASQVCEDNVEFIRRSATELLRNKASREAMKKNLINHGEDEAMIDKVIHSTGDIQEGEYDMVDESVRNQTDADDSDDDAYVLAMRSMDSVKREKMMGSDMAAPYSDKRGRI